jgi:hypothetical protein
MVRIKKDTAKYYSHCIDLLSNYFYVYQDDTTYLYKIHSKNKIIQFIQFLFDFHPLGWVSVNYDQTVDMYGDPEIFREAAEKLEENEFKVTIYF